MTDFLGVVQVNLEFRINHTKMSMVRKVLSKVQVRIDLT